MAAMIWGSPGSSVRDLVPLHVGPGHIFEVADDGGGYVKLHCTLCKQTVELAHCRARRHLKKLAEQLE
eukprot:3259499-Lingulodinium_polyedra.AAC.1